jgi:hypothetical protein
VREDYSLTELDFFKGDSLISPYLMLLLYFLRATTSGMISRGAYKVVRISYLV